MNESQKKKKSGMKCTNFPIFLLDLHMKNRGEGNVWRLTCRGKFVEKISLDFCMDFSWNFWMGPSTFTGVIDVTILETFN
jgi:hypothetical protein